MRRMLSLPLAFSLQVVATELEVGFGKASQTPGVQEENRFAGQVVDQRRWRVGAGCGALQTSLLPALDRQEEEEVGGRTSNYNPTNLNGLIKMHWGAGCGFRVIVCRYLV